MIITTELAQQITDHILPILQQNINIMNKNGVIIGSGQKHRIGDFHKGAKDAIDTGQEVEIRFHDLDRFPGALPGVNLPITVSLQTIGAVGVSGDPDEVRQATRLVKMVTELILEREVLAEDLRSYSRQKEQFVSLLLSDQAPGVLPQLSRQAKRLEFNLDLPRIVAAVNGSSLFDSALAAYGASGLVTTRTQDSLLQSLTAASFLTPQDMPVFLDGRLVILKHFQRPFLIQTAKNWCVELIRQLHDDHPGHNFFAGVGSLAVSPVKLQISQEESLFSLSRCQEKEPVRSIHDPSTLLAFLLKNPNAADSCSAFAELKSKFTGDLDKRYDLRKTLLHLLYNNQNLTQTSQSLFIHRNTLLFRLEKLKGSTGLCPGQSFEHAVLCKIILDSLV